MQIVENVNVLEIEASRWIILILNAFAVSTQTPIFMYLIPWLFPTKFAHHIHRARLQVYVLAYRPG